MKKLLAILLCLLLAVPMAMADDAFKELKYEVGRDLPAGEYELVLEGESAIAGHFILRPTLNDFEVIKGAYLMASNPSCKVTLLKGDTLCITMTSDGNVKINPVPTANSRSPEQGLDLSSMSLAELIALREQITLAMWETDEWQEVTVPQGVWKVGEDIPAGTWTVRCADTNRKDAMMFACFLDWGESLSSSGKSIAWKGRNDSAIIYNPNHKNYSSGAMTEYSFTVQEGDYIIIETGYAQAVFTPYAGKPALGFK